MEVNDFLKVKKLIRQRPEKALLKIIRTILAEN